jgi:predicted acyl esterase
VGSTFSDCVASGDAILYNFGLGRGRGCSFASGVWPLAGAAFLPTEWNIPLRDHDHGFLKGHRLMVQIQSTWFPLIDRNPQKFVPSIYKAAASDFIPAAQRIYCTPQMPSHLVLPVMK